MARSADTIAPSVNAGNLDLASLEAAGKAVLLAPATAPPAPAPPSLAAAPPLKPHEVFGFAPYWTLDQAGGFNLAGISTLAYFAVGVNPDGTLDQSGPGWTGYESQALANLVTQAHAAGDRVVLTVNNFDQGQLDALTSSPTAAATLAAAIVAAVEAKNLDGVNLDLEGQGSADNAGLTRLVDTVSWVMHTANPHYQVTMDTYSSSASGTNGWFDIPALAGRGRRVLRHGVQPEPGRGAGAVLAADERDVLGPDRGGRVRRGGAALQGDPGRAVLRHRLADDGRHVERDGDGAGHRRVAGRHRRQRPSPVLGPGDRLGLDLVPGGHAVARDLLRGPDVALRRRAAGAGARPGRRRHLDPRHGRQRARGSRGPARVRAGRQGRSGRSRIDVRVASGGHVADPAHAVPDELVGSDRPDTRGSAVQHDDHDRPPASSTDDTRTTSTTTTTLPPAYSGQWKGTTVTLTKVIGTPPAVSGTSPVGQLTGFQTQVLAVQCLTHEPDLNVWAVSGTTDQFLVVAAPPADCTTADFVFTAT